MSTQEHRRSAGNLKATCCVMTVSDTRTPDNDASGRFLIESLVEVGHTVQQYTIVPDEPEALRSQLTQWLALKPDLILTTGGTGIAKRDTTVEVVAQFLDKQLEGFGELFRMLSWEQVQSAAMLSRAIAGLADETLIFAMPGSRNAVEVGMTKLILPELSHLVWERRR